VAAAKVFVLGSNSFSGAWFVDELLNDGCEVVGISRSGEPPDVFLPYKKNSRVSHFHFFPLDLNRDLRAIVDLVASEKPEYFVNFSSQGMVAQSWQKPEDWFQTNTLSNVKLHDQLRRFSFLKKYVHISTPEVYGSNDSGAIVESHIYNPSTPYAVSRAAADMSLMSFFKAYSFPVVWTRAANVFGPGQQLYRIVPRAVLSFLTGKKLQLHGGGHSRRSFIHIRDVVKGTWWITQNGKPGEVFHLSTDELISIRELVERLAGMMDVNFDQLVEVVGERLGKDETYHLDSRKLRSFGWRPETTLDTGLAEVISWARANLDELKRLPWDYHHKS